MELKGVFSVSIGRKWALKEWGGRVVSGICLSSGQEPRLALTQALLQVGVVADVGLWATQPLRHSRESFHFALALRRQSCCFLRAVCLLWGIGASYLEGNPSVTR